MPVPGVAAMEVDEEAHSTTSSGASTASLRRSSSRPIRKFQRYSSPNMSDARDTRDDALKHVAVWCSHTAASFVVFASSSLFSGRGASEARGEGVLMDGSKAGENSA